MANDIARLGFVADTAALADAKADLQALVPPAERAQKAADATGSALDRMAAGAAASGAALDGAARGADVAGASIAKVTNVNNSAFASTTRLAEGYDVLTGKINGNFLAINNNLQRLNLLPNSLGNVSKSLKLTAAEGLGFTRQFADIGVTAAMGMNPFMIALQQGPQLFDILQMKAIQTGSTVGAVFKAMAVQAWAALGPIAGIIAAIGVAVGVVVGAFALGARDINNSTGSIIDGLNLTEKQLERVKKAGVDTSVTISDVFVALYDELSSRLYKTMAPALDWFGKAWDATLDAIAKGVYNTVRQIVAFWTGAVRAIANSWRLLPRALGDLVIGTANAMVKTIEDMINASINGINYLLSFAKSMGIDIGTIGNVTLGRISNTFSGAGAEFGKALMEGFMQGSKDGAAWVDDVADAVAERARKRREGIIKAAAGKADDPAAGSTRKPGVDKAARDLAKKLEGKEPSMQKDERRDEFFKTQIRDMEELQRAMERERGEIGLTGAALEGYRKETELLVAARKAGLADDPAILKAIHDSAMAYGVMRDEINKARESFEFIHGTAKGFFTDMLSGLREGQSVWTAFGNAVLNVLNKLIDKLADSAIDSLLNGLIGGGKSSGGGILGDLFSGLVSGVTKNAKGNAFTNSVVGSPTAFAFGRGGANLGIMGEAGPEGILPLQRGPDGKLGVTNYGGKGANDNGRPIIIQVQADEGAMFVPRVKALSEETAVTVTQAGIAAYNDQMPDRFQQIAADERAR